MLDVKDLKVFFPVHSGLFQKVTGYVHAVNGMSLYVKAGEIVGLVGESGSGKTTLGKAIVHLVKPTEGTIVVQATQVQMIFQDPYSSLNPRKSIAEAIGEPLRVHELAKTAEEEERQVIEALELAGMKGEDRFRYPHEFSGGQQQRICIARAIALQPKLLICDEAVSALDVSVQAQILNLLKDLRVKKEVSILFISHDLSVVRHLCDRVVVMYLGKVMEEGPTEALFEHPCHPYTQALLSAIPRMHPLKKKDRMILKGEIPSPLHPPSGCPFRTRCPYAEPRCAHPPPIQEVSPGHLYACIRPPEILK